MTREVHQDSRDIEQNTAGSASRITKKYGGKAYVPPQILSAEPLEIAAAACADNNPSGPGKILCDPNFPAGS